MIIKYYGGYLSKPKLIEMTKTNKEGTTAFHLKDTLEKIGFKAEGVKCSLADIKNKNVILPCIANVTVNNSYKHFIVIYEVNIKKNYLIIGDPADKIKKISFEKFDQIFNNVLITFYPVDNIKKEDSYSKLKFIIHLLKPHKKELKNLFILSIFITVFSIILSFYTGYMISGIHKYSKNYLVFLFSIFFSTFLLKLISNYFRSLLLIFINKKIDLKLTLGVFNKIIKLPYHYYKNKNTGDIVSRIKDLNDVKLMISKVALSLFVDLPLATLSIIILYMINSTLFKIGVIILILYILIIFIFKPFLNDYVKKEYEQNGKITSFMVEAINSFESIKGIHLEQNIIDKFESKYINYLKYANKLDKTYILQESLKALINDIGFMFITLIGCFLVMDNRFELGSLFTFTSLLIFFLDPIKNIINLDRTIKEAKNSLERIFELNYDIKENGIIESVKVKNIDIKNLNYSFNDRDLVLRNISININRNSKVMVVGKSGSGKSTLFKLLLKYHQIDNDNIFINKVDINNYKVDALNKKIVYVGQNETLFNDTVYNNLVFNDSDKSFLLKISKMCYVEEILDKKLGFNTLIQENGFNLSGGEKQRIALSRALMKKFDVLIIDEGLNQVDVNLERRILKNIFNYFNNKIIIVISHRLDNLDLFNQLIEVENGVIKKNECRAG